MSHIKLEDVPKSLHDRAVALNTQVQADLPDIERRLQEITTNPSPSARRVKAWAIADAISRAAHQHGPCGTCTEAYCCFQMATISRDEARVLSKFSGAPMAEPSPIVDPEVEFAKSKQYAGKPCPFLDPASRRCKVYEVRPYVCRAHHSIEDSTDPCEIVGTDHREVRMVNYMPVTAVITAVELSNGAYADIREWFPTL